MEFSNKLILFIMGVLIFFLSQIIIFFIIDRTNKCKKIKKQIKEFSSGYLEKFLTTEKRIKLYGILTGVVNLVICGTTAGILYCRHRLGIGSFRAVYDNLLKPNFPKEEKELFLVLFFLTLMAIFVTAAAWIKVIIETRILEKPEPALNKYFLGSLIIYFLCLLIIIAGIPVAFLIKHWFTSVLVSFYGIIVILLVSPIRPFFFFKSEKNKSLEFLSIIIFAATFLFFVISIAVLLIMYIFLV